VERERESVRERNNEVKEIRSKLVVCKKSLVQCHFPDTRDDEFRPQRRLRKENMRWRIEKKKKKKKGTLYIYTPGNNTTQQQLR
jgi:hypothetical protein